MARDGRTQRFPPVQQRTAWSECQAYRNRPIIRRRIPGEGRAAPCGGSCLKSGGAFPARFRDASVPCRVAAICSVRRAALPESIPVSLSVTRYPTRRSMPSSWRSGTAAVPTPRCRQRAAWYHRVRRGSHEFSPGRRCGLGTGRSLRRRSLQMAGAGATGHPVRTVAHRVGKNLTIKSGPAEDRRPRRRGR